MCDRWVTVHIVQSSLEFEIVRLIKGQIIALIGVCGSGSVKTTFLSSQSTGQAALSHKLGAFEIALA